MSEEAEDTPPNAGNYLEDYPIERIDGEWHYVVGEEHTLVPIRERFEIDAQLKRTESLLAVEPNMEEENQTTGNRISSWVLASVGTNFVASDVSGVSTSSSTSIASSVRRLPKMTVNGREYYVSNRSGNTILVPLEKAERYHYYFVDLKPLPMNNESNVLQNGTIPDYTSETSSHLGGPIYQEETPTFIKLSKNNQKLLQSIYRHRSLEEYLKIRMIKRIMQNEPEECKLAFEEYLESIEREKIVQAVRAELRQIVREILENVNIPFSMKIELLQDLKLDKTTCLLVNNWNQRQIERQSLNASQQQPMQSIARRQPQPQQSNSIQPSNCQHTRPFGPFYTSVPQKDQYLSQVKKADSFDQALSSTQQENKPVLSKNYHNNSSQPFYTFQVKPPSNVDRHDFFGEGKSQFRNQRETLSKIEKPIFSFSTPRVPMLSSTDYLSSNQESPSEPVKELCFSQNPKVGHRAFEPESTLISEEQKGIGIKPKQVTFDLPVAAKTETPILSAVSPSDSKISLSEEMLCSPKPHFISSVRKDRQKLIMEILSTKNYNMDLLTDILSDESETAKTLFYTWKAQLRKPQEIKQSSTDVSSVPVGQRSESQSDPFGLRAMVAKMRLEGELEPHPEKLQLHASPKLTSYPAATLPNHIDFDCLAKETNILLISSNESQGTFLNAFTNYFVYGDAKTAWNNSVHIPIPFKRIQTGRTYSTAKRMSYGLEDDIPTDCSTLVFKYKDKSISFIRTPRLLATDISSAEDNETLDQIIEFAKYFSKIDLIMILLNNVNTQESNDEKSSCQRLFTTCLNKLEQKFGATIRKNISFEFINKVNDDSLFSVVQGSNFVKELDNSRRQTIPSNEDANDFLVFTLSQAPFIQLFEAKMDGKTFSESDFEDLDRHWKGQATKTQFLLPRIPISPITMDVNERYYKYEERSIEFN